MKRGVLSRDELYKALALIGLAQAGEEPKESNLAQRHEHPPIKVRVRGSARGVFEITHGPLLLNPRLKMWRVWDAALFAPASTWSTRTESWKRLRCVFERGINVISSLLPPFLFFTPHLPNTSSSTWRWPSSRAC